MFFEDPVIFWVAPPAKSIRQNIKVGGNPLRVPFKIIFDLQGGKMAGHLETDLVTSSAVLEEIKTCRGVSFPGDLMAVPRGAPEVTGHDVSEELEVGDGEGLEVRRRGTGDKFIVGKIENANTWEAVVPTIRTGIFGDVGGGGELEEGDAIAELDGLDPPVDVLEERGVQNDIEARRGGAAFCCEDAVEK